MKKIVLKLDQLHDDMDKQRAMKAVTNLTGIDSISMDMKEMKMTVIGVVDPITVVSKLRKTFSSTHIVSVGPKEEPKKEEVPKKEEEPKKEEAKVQDPKKSEDHIEQEKKKIKEAQEQFMRELVMNSHKAYYYPRMTTQQYYYVQSAEENPNSCSIF